MANACTGISGAASFAACNFKTTGFPTTSNTTGLVTCLTGYVVNGTTSQTTQNVTCSRGCFDDGGGTTGCTTTVTPANCILRTVIPWQYDDFKTNFHAIASTVTFDRGELLKSLQKRQRRPQQPRPRQPRRQQQLLSHAVARQRVVDALSALVHSVSAAVMCGQHQIMCTACNSSMVNACTGVSGSATFTACHFNATGFTITSTGKTGTVSCNSGYVVNGTTAQTTQSFACYRGCFNVGGGSGCSTTVTPANCVLCTIIASGL